MELVINTVSNHLPFVLSLHSELIETRNGEKLVLAIPNNAARIIKKPVPGDCLDLSVFGYPKQLIIVLAEGPNCAGLPVGERFNVTVEQVEKIENGYTVEYRAKVSSQDIEAFKDQHGIEQPSPNLWSKYSELHILIGTDLIANPEKSNGVTFSEKLKMIRLFVLCCTGGAWFVLGLVGFALSDHAALENIGYLLAALVIWLAAVAAHWIGRTFACTWFSSVVLMMTIWGMQS